MQSECGVSKAFCGVLIPTVKFFLIVHLLNYTNYISAIIHPTTLYTVALACICQTIKYS